jgi:hypothetical protein
MQENCIILLKQIIKNQNKFLAGFEKDIYQVLFECRSDGSPQAIDW